VEDICKNLKFLKRWSIGGRYYLEVGVFFGFGNWDECGGKGFSG
jgi:hypothetical protein